MKWVFTFFVLGQCLNLSGQGQLEEFLFSHEIERLIAHDSLSLSRASIFYSRIGDYQSSMRLSEVEVSWGVDTVDLGNYSIAPALAKIVDRAKNEKIVMISESHTRPQHRLFSKRLIDSLSDHGFKTLFMETLGNYPDINGVWTMADNELQDRGYALRSFKTGTYTLEPSMAGIVRTALRKGISVKAYESIGRKKGTERDLAQAANIIDQWKGEKIIIHCGWHHVIESDQEKRKNAYWLAKNLKDSLGVDPLTIYQDNFTEKVTDDQHPILIDIDIKEPSVFIKNGKIPRLSKQVDIEVIHPLTVYKSSRPNWLYEGGRRIAYQVEMEGVEVKYPVLVAAFIPGEEDDGVPIDMVEFKHKYDRKPLVLEPGKYILVIDNKSSGISREILVQK